LRPLGLLVFFSTLNPGSSPATRNRSPCLLRINFRPFHLQPLDAPTYRFFHIATSTYVMIFRLRPTHAGSPQHPAESSSSPTDWSFISSCSPHHLAVTQLLLITELWLSPTRTCTVLFMRLRRRTCASFLSASYGPEVFSPADERLSGPTWKK